MPHIEIAAEHLFSVSGFPITNTLIASWIAVGALLVVAFAVRRVRPVPGGLQSAVEVFLEGMLGLMASVLGSREKAERSVPIVGTVFLFILASNWLGVFPGVGSLVWVNEKAHSSSPLLRSAASDLNFTLALGILAVLLVNINGMRSLGATAHLSKFFTFKNPILSFVGVLEFISEFAKIISFSFRLFGNVFAGEVLLTVTAFVAARLTPAPLAPAQPILVALGLLPFVTLELFVGFVQALVFAMLMTVFLSIAVSHH